MRWKDIILVEQHNTRNLNTRAADLEQARLRLANEREKLQRRHDEQLSHLRFFEQALHVSRERLTGIISDWKQSFIAEVAWLDGAKPE